MYVVGTKNRTRKAVVVFDVVVGLYRMLWVRIFVPARLCVALDVVIGLYHMLWVRFFVPVWRW